MSSRDYKRAIIDGLLKKYHDRCARNIITNRRIILKPTEIYANYEKNDADLQEKQSFHEAVAELLRRGFVTADYLKFSDDIEKVYLIEDQIAAIYGYLEKVYGVVPQSMLVNQVNQIAEKHIADGKIVKAYCETILEKLKNPGCTLVPERVEANLKMLRLLENNTESLYVREASILVYGDSKWFECNNYEEICTFLRIVTETPREDGERNDAILSRFNVIPTDQEIFIKGDWKIEWDHYILDVAKLTGGVAISSVDFPNIVRISVQAERVMTIENKTSYQRMNGNRTAMMYLGGFANRHQIEFLKWVISDNPDIKYLHFGDIDIGGFLIHKHLCHETSKQFELYCMGIQQLKDIRYRHCLKKLAESDYARLPALMADDSYRDTLQYMQEHNVKLEQEIVSYYLMQ